MDLCFKLCYHMQWRVEAAGGGHNCQPSRRVSKLLSEEPDNRVVCVTYNMQDLEKIFDPTVGGWYLRDQEQGGGHMFLVRSHCK